MRRAAKVDANQPAIVKALRAIGASVQPLHTIGQGCPDLLVGYRGRNVVLECKDEDQPPSKRQLTPDQREWIAGWRGGQVWVVHSVEQAIEAVTA
jgi:hypothetical protein